MWEVSTVNGLLRDEPYHLRYEYNFDKPSESYLELTGNFEVANNDGTYGKVVDGARISNHVTVNETREFQPEYENDGLAESFNNTFKIARSGWYTYDNIKITAIDANDIIEQFCRSRYSEYIYCVCNYD